MKLFYIITLILAYFFFFFIIHLIHFNFFEVDVVLYSSLFDFLISLLIILIIIYFIKSLNFIEKAFTFTLLISFGVIYSLSIPTIIDRSLSFYILEKIQQRDGGILKSSLNEIFVSEYIQEHKLMDMRLTEQLKSGTVYIDNDCIRLTSRGDFIAKFSYSV